MVMPFGSSGVVWNRLNNGAKKSIHSGKNKNMSALRHITTQEWAMVSLQPYFFLCGRDGSARRTPRSLNNQQIHTSLGLASSFNQFTPRVRTLSIMHFACVLLSCEPHVVDKTYRRFLPNAIINLIRTHAQLPGVEGAVVIRP